MPFRYGFAVANPRANNVQRVFRRQFGLPARPKVLEQLRPCRQAGATDDPLKLRPKVEIRAAPLVDDVNRPRLGLVEYRFKMRP